MDTKEQLIDQLSKLHNPRTLILTIGNMLRGDDAIGPIIFEQLKGKLSSEIIDAGTVPENYIQTIIKKSPEVLLVIDAIDFAAPAGTIRMFKPSELSSLILSTHSLSPRVFVDMIADEIDVEVHFIGIQPLQIQIGCSLSDAVDEAAKLLVSVMTRVFGSNGLPIR